MSLAAALIYGEESEPFAGGRHQPVQICPQQIMLTHSNDLVPNKDTSCVVILLERIQHFLEEGELRLIPRWTLLEGN